MNNSTASSVEPPGLTIFRLFIEVAIALAGIIGNIMVCVVITTSLKTRKPTNTFLLSLAIADLGVLLFNFPIAISKIQQSPKYIFGEFFCLYIAPATETFFGSSIWSITAIAVDRYRNIVGATSLRHRTSLKNLRIAIVAIWIVSFIVASLPIYTITDYKDDRCTIVWPDQDGANVTFRAYTIFLAVVWYVLPLLIISFTYLRIRQRVSHSIHFRATMVHEIQGKMEDIRRRQLRDNEKTKRILSPLVILFAISMIPITALRLTVAFVTPDEMLYFVWFNVLVIFVALNSSLNPILYYIVSKEFRLAYQIIINRLCKCCWKPFIDGFEKRWHSRGSSTAVGIQPKIIQNLSFEQPANTHYSSKERPFQIMSSV